MKSLDGAYLEEVILRGIKSVRYIPVFPGLKDGWKIEGGVYLSNLKPYKMVAIQYKDSLKNGSTGFALLTGMKDGKIMICGFKKSVK